MNNFLTIGLPWALSLSGVFYFGLHLGSSSINQSLGPTSTIGPVDRDLKSPQLNNAHRTTAQRSQENIIQIPSQFSNPTLPPNLERIMEGGDLIERMGAYLDAVRAMDQGNAQSVVGAFEALPKGYGLSLIHI